MSGVACHHFPLGSKNSLMKSCMRCHHRVWTTFIVGQYRACYAIIAIRKHTLSEDVRHDMPSSPLQRTNGWLTSGMACHHPHWTTYMVRLCQAWHAIMDLVQHIWLDKVGHGRPSSPFDSIYMFGKTSGVACHHRPWTAYTVKRRQTWHINIALGLDT